MLKLKHSPEELLLLGCCLFFCWGFFVVFFFPKSIQCTCTHQTEVMSFSVFSYKNLVLNMTRKYLITLEGELEIYS